MAFGLPNVSFIGYPVAVPCAGHAGLGLRQASRADSEALVEHFQALTPEDRRMRFCATLNDEALRNHVDGLWDAGRGGARGHDGPLWSGPLHRAGPVRALAELRHHRRGGRARHQRRAPRCGGAASAPTWCRPPRGCSRRAGCRRIRATTLHDNHSFVALAQACGAEVVCGPDGVDVVFDVAALSRAYLRRRAAQVFRPVA